MGLIKRNIHMDGCRHENKTISLDQDYNIPDMKPDAKMIIREQGDIVNLECRSMGEKFGIKGEMSFQILYTAEENGQLACLRGSIPFEETLAVKMGERDEDYEVQVRVEKLNVRLINSRKTNMSAILGIDLVDQKVCDNMICVGVEPEEGLQIKTREVEVSALEAARKDTYRVREQWRLPGTRDSIGEILYWDIRLAELDYRSLEDEIQLNGQAKVFVVYASEGEDPVPNIYENTLVIEGKLPCSGAKPEMASRITSAIVSKDIGVEQDEDGENRMLEAELVLGFNLRIYSKERMNLVTDLYSTAMECKPVVEHAGFKTLVTDNKCLERVQGEIGIPGKKPLQIWDVCGTLRIDNKELKEGNLEVQGVIPVKIVYRRDDSSMPVNMAEGVIPFRYTIEGGELKEGCLMNLQGRIEQISASLAGDEKVLVKAVVGLELIAFWPSTEPMVVDYECVPRDSESMNSQPGMVGYVMQPGDTLWDVAKEYHTTVDQVLEINKMNEEEVVSGDMLLVVPR